MSRTIFLIIFVALAHSQDTLVSLSSCLSNCAMCAPNELSTCSGQQYVQCMKGYNGTSCPVKPTFAKEQVLIDENKQRVESTWQLQKTTKCGYKNSKMQETPVHVLGLYSDFDYNQVSVDIQPYYSNFVASFNLIRGTWTPFSDLLRVAVLDEQDNILAEYFIEYPRRDEINPKKDLLTCNSQPVLIEKYQIEGEIDPASQSKLIIKFEGMMFSQAIWGLTNVKIAFGCSKFLLFNGVECGLCGQGYYGVHNIHNDIVSCQPCPLKCTKCQSEAVCLACQSGFELSNGECSNKYLMKSFPMANKTVNCPSQSFQLSSTESSQEKLTIELSELAAHKKARAIFLLAYTSNALDNGHKISISVNGIKQKDIDGKYVGKQTNRPKQICKGFGKEGYYELIKYVSAYVDHRGNNIIIHISGDQGIKFGVESILIQYEQEIQLIQDPVAPAKPETAKTGPESPIFSKQIVVEPVPPPKQISKKDLIIEKQEPPKVQEANKPQKQSLEQTPIIQAPKPVQKVPDPKANITELAKIEQSQAKISTEPPIQTIKSPSSLQNIVSQPINDNTKESEQIEHPTSPLKPEITKPQADKTNYTNQVVIANGHIHKASEIAKSIQKLQNNKWNIRTGLKTDKSLIISLYYPIEIEHFPYFVATLENKNMSIVPRVLDKSKQEQELHFDLDFSLLAENIDIFMKEKPPQINRRNLQQSDNLHLSSVHVQRFDYLPEEEWRKTEKFSAFFEVLAWVTIISTIILSFFSNSVITQKLSLLLQIIFLHSFIFDEYLPPNFRFSINGLRRMQNLNYFHSSVASSIEQWLLGNVTQYSPTKFTINTKDINFTRSIYPCVIINFIYLTWFLLLKVVKSRMSPVTSQMGDGDNNVVRLRIKLYIERLAERTMNFWSQVWQYQYIAFLWAACIQFYNLAYPPDSDRSQVPNTIFCIVCFILALILPIFTTIVTRRAYGKLDYIEYCYWYENLFYQQLPCQTFPSKHHNSGILVGNIRYLLLVLFIAYVGDFPIQCLVCLIIFQFSYLLYTNLVKLEVRPICLLLNIMEYIFLIILAIGMLVAVSLSRTLQTNEYMVIGSVLTVVSLLLCAVGLARVLYYIWNKVSDGVLMKERSSVSQEADEGE